MHFSTTLFAALASSALAIPTPQAGPPDNTIVKESPKFYLRGENVGVNQDVFGNDTYLVTYHVYAGDSGTLAALGSKENAPAWSLKGTELYLEEGGAQLQFQPEGQAYPFSVSVNNAGTTGFTDYLVKYGEGTPSFGNYTVYGGDGSLYVSHMSASQNAPSYGCKGDIEQTKDAIVIKYGDRHIDPVTPEGCSEIRFKVELA